MPLRLLKHDTADQAAARARYAGLVVNVVGAHCDELVQRLLVDALRDLIAEENLVRLREEMYARRAARADG